MQKLQEELRKAQEDLSETEWEKDIADRKKLLSELYDDYETFMNQRLDNLEELVREMVEGVSANAGAIQDTIHTAAEQAGYSVTDGMSEILDGGVYAYYDRMFSGMTSIGDYLYDISSHVAEMAEVSAAAAREAARHEDSYPTGASDTAAQHSNEAIDFASRQIGGVDTAAITGSGEFDQHEALLRAFGEKGAPAEEHTLDVGSARLRVNISKDKMNIRFTDMSSPGMPRYEMPYATFTRYRNTGELQQKLYDWLSKYEDISLDDIKNMAMPFITGGLADYTGLAMLHGTRTKPEIVLNANDTEKFLAAAKLMRTPVMSALVDKSFRMPDIAGASGGGDIHIELGGIQIEHVQDYNDFVRQLRDDPKFEKLISAMTFDPMSGKTSFGRKNRIRW